MNSNTRFSQDESDLMSFDQSGVAKTLESGTLTSRRTLVPVSLEFLRDTIRHNPRIPGLQKEIPHTGTHSVESIILLSSKIQKDQISS